MSAQISMCVCLYIYIYIYILLDYFPYGTYDMRTHTFRCETVTSADAHSLWSGPFHHKIWKTNPDNKVHGAYMGPTWVLSTPDGLHVRPMNFAIRECFSVHPCHFWMDMYIHSWGKRLLHPEWGTCWWLFIFDLLLRSQGWLAGFVVFLCIVYTILFNVFFW